MKEKIYKCRWEVADDQHMKQAITWLLRQRPWQEVLLVNITRTGITITKSPMRPEVVSRKLQFSPQVDRIAFMNELSRDRNVSLLWTFQKTVLLTYEDAGIYERIVKRRIQDGELELEDISGKEMCDRLQSLCTENTAESYPTFKRFQDPSLPSPQGLQVYNCGSIRYSLPPYSSDNSASGKRADCGESTADKKIVSLQCETCADGTKNCVFLPCGDLYQCCRCAADVNICSKCAAKICFKQKVFYALCKDCRTN